MSRVYGLLLGVGLGLLAGCGSGMKQENIEVKEPNDPLAPARTVLKRLADGDPLTSETTAFPKMVADVRQVDPQRADILEQGFADIEKAPPGARKAKAKALLQKLGAAPK